MPLRSLYSSLPNSLRIDTIESLCRKQERIARIKTGCFDLKPITDNAKVSGHIKKLIKSKRKGTTSGLYAPNAPFNFAVISLKENEYKKARFIAFGLAGYKRELTSEAQSLLNAIFSICPITSIKLYNKALKDGLAVPLWRIEFTLPVSVSLRLYEPPIEDIEKIIIIVFDY